MAFPRHWFLVWFALVLGGGSVFAAPSREDKAYDAAVATFNYPIYDQAETQFGQFIEKYPKSRRVPQATLLMAQAQFKQQKYQEAIETLTNAQPDWGALADQYTYWLGEAQFARGDFDHAAETFSSLAATFTNSPLRLTAIIEAATAYARLENWPQIEQLLASAGSVFAAKAATDSDAELISRGRLLLAQAQLAQKNYAAAGATLKLLNSQTLPASLDWQRTSLQCRVLLGQDDLEGALAVTTNLMASARQQKDDAPARLADSVALRGTVLEQLGRWQDAATTWTNNLVAGAPVERQREAIMKMAADATAQKDYTGAEAALAQFVLQFSNSPAADLALLTQGELNLKQYVAQRDQTNRLAAALQNFNQLLAPHSTAPDLVGRAFLDRGWCYWLQDNYATSLPDFQAATAKLPVSPEQAVARFKMGDAEFALGHFPAAITNYQAVLDHFSHLPDVRQSLNDRALYQIVRASVKLQDAATAEKAMRRLLADFPKSDLGENAELLLGEGLSSFDAPTNAVQVFRDFVKRFPDSPLRPQAELDVARTYEREQNWPAAIASYQNWLAAFPTNQQTELRAQAEYSLAWSEYQSGNETNALSRFTAFVSQYPTSPLAPVAQWWVADYYFRQGGTSYSEAEKNYEYIFQNTNTVWQQSSLFYPAQLMAARAAVGRQDYQGAVNFYLTRLLSDTNCPAPLQRQAKFAYGGVLMRWDSPDTNRPYLNFETASNVFAELGADNATNQYGPLAWSELGDCNLQLGALPAATNAYTRAMNSPSASVGLRCRAQVGLGRVLEKMAENAAADSDRQALLQQALKNYLAVFQTSMGNGLNDNESPQAFWVAKAGLLMLPLLSKDGHYPANFFDRMESLLPQLKDSLEKKKAALAAENN